GQADGATPSFYEPGGLSYANGKLYVADTNNHAIRVVDAHTGETATLVLRGLQPPAIQPARAPDANVAAPNAEEIKLAPQRVQAGDAALGIDVAPPPGYHLNEAAPQRAQVSVVRGAPNLALAGDSPVLTRAGHDVRLPLRLPLR